MPGSDCPGSAGARRQGSAVTGSAVRGQEGKHGIEGAATLFYMVHCGKALYNNLLWSNWSPAALSKLVIIGNSFRGIEERSGRALGRLSASHLLSSSLSRCFTASDSNLPVFLHFCCHKVFSHEPSPPFPVPPPCRKPV